MTAHILLLGREEVNFNYFQSALSSSGYSFQFLFIDEARAHPTLLNAAALIVLDTIPYREKEFGRFSFLQHREVDRSIPVLALVKETPPRLRYRLVDLGVDDYLTVPFDRLDAQVRVKNLLRQKEPPPREEPGLLHPISPVSALRQLDDINQKLHRILFDLPRPAFLETLLEALQRLCKSHYTLLFEVEDSDTLRLMGSQPTHFAESGGTMATNGIPPLQKAVRLKEPTVLNRISPDNPLVTHVKALLNVNVRAVIIYPVLLQERCRYVLCVLKSDQEQFTDFHFLLVQNFSHFIVHSFYLAHLRRAVKKSKDNPIWQFYFEFLDQVINQLNFGIMVVSDDHKIRYINENCAKLLNVDPAEALYQPLSQLMSEDNVKMILAASQEGIREADRAELTLEAPDGQKTLIGFTVQPYADKMNQESGLIVSLKDITYTKEVQEEMRRVDRLASLGVMASGIAHEIRNPLAGIKAMAQTFEEELGPDDPRSEYVQRIIRLVNRLDDLLRTLFSYAKPPKPNRRPGHIEIVLREVISLVRQKFKEQNIQLIQSLHPDLPEVFVDPAQIQQVLVNLLLNSIESIREGGEIKIQIQPIFCQEDGAKVPAPVLALGQNRDYVEVLIQDNGCGISEENLKHIFNPFFTTKTFGTGLGLSIVYQIVKENEGIIHFESEVDRGTACYLYLPANEG